MLVVGMLVVVSPKDFIVLKSLAGVVSEISEGVVPPGRGSPKLYSPKRCYLVRYIRKGLDKLAGKVLDFSRASKR